MEGRGVFADFGTDGDRGERTIGLELYVMINESPEWGDEMGGLVVKVLVTGDVFQEVPVSELVLGAPNLASSFVDDGVLVGVALLFQETRRRSKDVREEGEVHLKVFFEVGKSWLYLGGCWRYRGLGAGRRGWGRDTGNGGGGDGRWDVLDRNVLLVAKGGVGGDRALRWVLELTDDQVLEFVCHDHLSLASCSTHVAPPLLRFFSSCPLSLTRPPRVDRMFLIADSYASP